MKYTFLKKIDTNTKTILVPISESKITENPFNHDIPQNIFSGKKDTVYCFQNQNITYIYIGLGNNEEYKTIKTIFRRVASKQKDFFDENLAIILPENLENSIIEAIFLGFKLGTYNLGHFKKTDEHPLLKPNFNLQIISENDYSEIINKAFKIADAQLQVFNLVDKPANHITPKYLADWATKTGNKYGFDTKILGKKECQEEGLDAFLAVGQGSAEEPQFIIMDYNPKTANTKKHFGLVGKGVTFDTGGLNIKTAGMVHMKCDMAGAAAVLGAMQLIADLGLECRVTAIVPACENSVDANAFLPSNVINSYSKKTIEIIDTDAEGRLILADALSYIIKNYNPETIIDIATLTGSAVGTFAYDCAALFSNNADLVKNIQNSGDAIGERTWQLPLWDCYKSDIESEIADLKNYSGRPVAGAISAAKFLEAFTENHTSWAHIDIAGVAFVDDEFAKTKHATAFGTQLLTNFIADYI